MTTDPAPVQVTVRYWAGARAAAGVDAEQRRGSTAGEVLTAAAQDHPELGHVLQVASILLDGRTVDTDAPVGEGALLEVLPPFAGG